MAGAVRSTETSTADPAAVFATGTDSGADIRSPEVNATVYPFQSQVPEFCSFHVFVNFSPCFRFVLSGMVMSLTNTAPSLHVGAGVGAAGSSVAVAVGGIGVGRTSPGLVGGRVEVTKRSGASVGVVSDETVTQEDKRIMRIGRIFLYMSK